MPMELVDERFLYHEKPGVFHLRRHVEDVSAAFDALIC